MKKSIYRLITENLNQLVIDDEKSSIAYKKSDITNTTKFVNGLDNMYQIFKSGDDVLQYNSDSISLIFNNGYEAQLPEYADGKPRLIKITTPELESTDSEIIFPVNLFTHIDPESEWCYEGKITDLEQTRTNQNFITTKDDAIKDFSAIATNEALKKHIIWLPAYIKCHNETIKINDDIYKGYLPSLGQLHTLFKYADMINYIINTISSSPSYNNLYINPKYWFSPTTPFIWSSTENCDQYAWAIYPDDKSVQPVSKSKKGQVIPFFKKI